MHVRFVPLVKAACLSFLSGAMTSTGFSQSPSVALDETTFARTVWKSFSSESLDQAFEKTVKVARLLPGGKGVAKRLRQNFPWLAKKGEALEVRQADHNYRIWKPAVSSNHGTLHVTIKLDHMRSPWADDHAVLEVQVSPKGEISYKSVLEIRGQDKLDSGWIAAGTTTLFTAGAGAIAGVATELLNSLRKGVEDMGETGGRMLFPGVVTHVFNAICSSVRQT